MTWLESYYTPASQYFCTSANSTATDSTGYLPSAYGGYGATSSSTGAYINSNVWSTQPICVDWESASRAQAIGFDSSYPVGQWVIEENCYRFKKFVSSETPEQRAEREKNAAEAQKKYITEQEALQKERLIAKEKAETLLKKHIGLDAFGKLYQVGYIDVDSKNYPGRKYRVKKDTSSMIDVLDKDGKVVDRLCVHPAVECPEGDHVFTKVAFLEMDEEFILSKANHHAPMQTYQSVGQVQVGNLVQAN